MAAAVHERERQAPEAPGRLFDPGGERSLDDAVSLAWESLVGPDQLPACLVCDGRLVWHGDRRAAQCESCGSALE